MNEQSADAVDRKLKTYAFRLREEWDGPGLYGFDVAGPDLCEAFGEVSVDAAANITLADVAIDSADPSNTFPDEVVEGLAEVLVPHEPVLQKFLKVHGQDELYYALARHVDRLRESLIVAVHAEMICSHGSA